jgi:hypothetical protein
MEGRCSMIRLPYKKIRKTRRWKLAVSSETDDDGAHEWIVAVLRRDTASYSIEAMRHDGGKGDVVDIIDIDPGSSEAAKVKEIYQAFVMQWRLYALELGLPFDVDRDVRDWADEVLTPSFDTEAPEIRR